MVEPEHGLLSCLEVLGIQPAAGFTNFVGKDGIRARIK
jgi:hypothetical protein